ncbi:MAG: MmgE/PrpD family protein [Chloroflexota bacterium]|nr:MmgE/PrpD family protein [Chloroflexota bacterium]
MSPTSDVAGWVAGLALAAVPAVAVERAKAAILDTLAVTLAGSSEPVARLAAKIVAQDGARPVCSQLGGRLRTSAPEAAFLNGIAAHALDYDDVNIGPANHPSAVILPAALAVAEAREASGRQLLEAYVAGVEITSKFARALEYGHYQAGWHTTSTAGTMGAAMAAGKLLELDAKRLGTALGIAASEASGLRQNFGTMAKPFHAGHAARSGVTAARLAAEGFSAYDRILESQLGYFAIFNGPAGAAQQASEQLGRPFELESPGLAAKKFPCCYGLHRAAEGMLELVERAGFQAEDVRQVHVSAPVGELAPLSPERPRTGLEGKFSLGYALAAAVIDRRLTLATFTDAMVQRPAAQDFWPLVHAQPHADAALGRLLTEGILELNVRLNDGASHQIRVEDAPGTPARPLTPEERQAKLADCAGKLLSESDVASLQRLVASLEELPDVRELIAQLTAPSDSRR